MKNSKKVLRKDWEIADSKILKIIKDPRNETFKNQIFPVDLFPGEISSLIIESHRHLNLNMDYLGSAIMAVIMSLLGRYSSCLKAGWDEPVTGWFGLVGGSGSGKSPAIKLAVRPLYELDKMYYQKFKDEDSDVKEPRQHIVTDITYESLVDKLESNPSILDVKDELLSFRTDMSRYQGGNSESKYLSLWNCDPIKVNRRTDNKHQQVYNPRYNLLGGIQPDLLIHMFPKLSQSNGMLSRILFSMDSFEPRKTPRTDMDESIKDDYNRFVFKIKDHIESDESGIKKELCFADDAQGFFYDWCDVVSDHISNQQDLTENLKQGATKIRAYFIRFALVFEVIDAVSNGNKPEKTISIHSARKAAELCDFYLVTLVKVLSYIDSSIVKTKSMNEIILKSFFDKIPSGPDRRKAIQQIHNEGYSYSQIISATNLPKSSLSAICSHK